jgi:hypothetical protein
MSVKKITESVFLCQCDLKDCSGIDPKTGKPKTWRSKGATPPDRCRWCGRWTWNGTDKRQRLVTADGRTQNVSQWAKETGIAKATIRARLSYGWSDVEAVGLAERRKK